MPDFPRYDSQRSLTTQQPRALRNDADIQDSAEGLTKKASNALGIAQEGIIKYQQFTEKVQQDTALFNFKAGAQEISNAAVQDGDITSEAKYQSLLNNLAKNSTKGISSERVKNGLAAELNYMQSVASVGIQSEFMKKNLLHGQALAQANLDSLAQTPGSELAIQNAVKEAINTGYWDEVEGYKKEKQALKDMRDNSFRQDLNTDIEAAKKNLEKNTYGFDSKELSLSQRILRSAEASRKEQEQVLQFESSVEAGKALVDGTLTKNDIRDMVLNRKMDSELAGALEIGMYSPNQLKGQKPGVAAQMYIDMVDKMDKFNPETANAVLTNAIKDFSSKNPNINKVDLASIVNTIDAKRKDPQNPVWGALKVAVRAGIPHAAILEFFGVWDRESDPRPVMKQAIQSTYQKADPRAGQFIVGNKYPQGVFLGFNEETGKLKFGKSKDADA